MNHVRHLNEIFLNINAIFYALLSDLMVLGLSMFNGKFVLKSVWRIICVGETRDMT